MCRVLVIEPDADRRQDFATTLGFLEFDVTPAASMEAMAALLAGDTELDFVLLGPCADGEARLAFYRAVRAADVYLPILLVTPAGDSEDLDRELQEGIVARASYPLRSQPFQRSLEQISIYLENRNLSGESRSPELFRSLVGGSDATKGVRRLIEQVADTEATVLILGESGTGKEVVARNIHYHSSRRYKPFVPVNCGAIPGDLLESELFGHEKGAFTGAISARRGRFEMADGGTLFLDEIGDMPLSMQVKLLRVLQERVVERVGSNKSVAIDVRIIAATHANLEEAISAGRFREDLFYRLNVFPIETPPLRDRLEDLPVLINDLIARIENEKRGSVRILPAAIQALQQYPWPGNVRELANLIERLAILYPYGVVDVRDLPDKYLPQGIVTALEPAPVGEGGDTDLVSAALSAPRLPQDGLDLREHLSQLEYTLIQQALDEAGGVVAHAAKRLKMGRTTLVEKMRKYHIQRRDDVAQA